MATETYEVVFSGTLHGQFVQTVQHVQADIDIPVNPFSTALLINQTITGGDIINAWLECLPSDYVMTSSRVKAVLPAGGPTAIILASTFAESAGQRTGEISSAQVNPLMIWIPTTEPAKTGRLFFPGVSEADIDGMVYVPELIDAMQAFATAWIDGGTLGGSDTFKGAVLRKSAPPPPIVPVSSDLIAFGQISPLVGTQRRRLRPV